jgi:tetratricopeptide (TPR) repeat protein
MKAVSGVAFVALLFGATASRADSNALALYKSGSYAQSEKAGLAQGDAQGYAIAARAVLADEMMRAPCLDCLKRAEVYARRAIAADPKYAEGHIYLTVALGYESRIIGIIEARVRGYPKEAKDNIDEALADDPSNPWALAALGGWNIEIDRNAGATLGKWVYGATIDQGRTNFEKAIAADPKNLVVRYQYALALTAYDLDTYHEGIVASLTKALAITPSTAYETFEQNRARSLLDAIKSGDPDTIQTVVHRDQGYP